MATLGPVFPTLPQKLLLQYRIDFVNVTIKSASMGDMSLLSGKKKSTNT